jgi:hypothetical protein
VVDHPECSILRHERIRSDDEEHHNGPDRNGDRPSRFEFIHSPARRAADYAITHAHNVDDVRSLDLVRVEEDTPTETVAEARVPDQANSRDL